MSMPQFYGRCPVCSGGVTMTLEPKGTRENCRSWTGRCERGHDLALEASQGGQPVKVREPGPSPSIRDSKLAKGGKR